MAPPALTEQLALLKLTEKQETFPNVDLLADLTKSREALSFFHPAAGFLSRSHGDARRCQKARPRVSAWFPSGFPAIQATPVTREPLGVPLIAPVLKYPACILSCFPGDRHGSETLPRESPQSGVGLFFKSCAQP